MGEIIRPGRTDDGQHHFAIRAGNRQELARSGGFDAEEAATAAMCRLQIGIPALAAAYGVAAEFLETSAGEGLMIHVPRVGALGDAAKTHAPLLAGAVVGAEAAVLALHGAASSPAIGTAPVVPGLAPVPSAPLSIPSAPAPAVRQGRAAGVARFWPVPLAVLALACLAWGLNAHRPKAVEGLPKSTLMASPALASALLPSSAAPTSVTAPTSIRHVTGPVVLPSGQKKGVQKSFASIGRVVRTDQLALSTIPVLSKSPQISSRSHPAHRSKWRVRRLRIASSPSLQHA